MGVLLAAGITRPLKPSDSRRPVAWPRATWGPASGLRKRAELATVVAAFDDMAASLQAQHVRSAAACSPTLPIELRTPVTVIEGNLVAMLDGVYSRSDETLQLTLNRAEGLHRLVEDIRDLSLAEVGKLDLSIEPIPLARALETVASAVRGQALGTGLTLEVEPSPGATLADESRLAQALTNLLDNALRHTPPGGSITIRSGAVDATTAWIEVSDSGEGIAPRDLPHIFDRFYRGTDASGRKTRGSGLGLAIARALIMAMDGRLTAESTPSQGSTFRIYLPAADEIRSVG